MFCPECGREVPEGSMFCPACGRYLNAGYTYSSEGQPLAGDSTVTATYEPVYTPRPRPRYGATSALLVMAVVAVAVLVLFSPFLQDRGALYGQSFSEEYSGTYTDDEYRVEFSWTYLGGSFYFDIPVEKSDYTSYHSMNPYGRDVTDWSTCTDFVVLDDYTAAVVGKLAALYEKAFGKAPSNDQDYANFILAYVQVTYGYTSDLSLYGQEEYYAYPVETIVNLKGDCEDTAILCAALYRQAGFNSAVLIIPEHAMAGVALDDYTAPSLNSGEVISKKVNGLTYYACETTTSGFQPVGVNYSTYNGHYLSYYLNKGKIGQGLYTFYEVP